MTWPDTLIVLCAAAISLSSMNAFIPLNCCNFIHSLSHTHTHSLQFRRGRDSRTWIAARSFIFFNVPLPFNCRILYRVQHFNIAFIISHTKCSAHNFLVLSLSLSTPPIRHFSMTVIHSLQLLVLRTPLRYGLLYSNIVFHRHHAFRFVSKTLSSLSAPAFNTIHFMCRIAVKWNLFRAVFFFMYHELLIVARSRGEASFFSVVHPVQLFISRVPCIHLHRRKIFIAQNSLSVFSACVRESEDFFLFRPIS